MRLVSHLNYLHYGDALDRLLDVDDSALSRSMLKSEYLRHVLGARDRDPFVAEIVNGYGPPRVRYLNVGEFRRDLGLSQRARLSFADLRCRGFSHCFWSSPVGFPYRLRSQVNLRLVLATDSNLFYPMKVKRYLRTNDSNHYFVNDFPAIAFALGMASQTTWCIFVLQSDLAFRKPAYLREHFRGWRKILFSNIVEYARERRVKKVLLSRAKDVIRACHSQHHAPDRIPQSWRCIYDLTAHEFGMRLKQVRRRRNIQLFSSHPPIYADTFYELDLT